MLMLLPVLLLLLLINHIHLEKKLGLDIGAQMDLEKQRTKEELIKTIHGKASAMNGYLHTRTEKLSRE